MLLSLTEKKTRFSCKRKRRKTKLSLTGIEHPSILRTTIGKMSLDLKEKNRLAHCDLTDHYETSLVN